MIPIELYKRKTPKSEDFEVLIEKRDQRLLN